jgi:hypothetical protein
VNVNERAVYRMSDRGSLTAGATPDHMRRLIAHHEKIGFVSDYPHVVECVATPDGFAGDHDIVAVIRRSAL